MRIVGLGDTPAKVIDSIKESVEVLGDEAIKVNMASFADLITEIETAEKEGIEFSGQALPDPAEILAQ